MSYFAPPVKRSGSVTSQLPPRQTASDRSSTFSFATTDYSNQSVPASRTLQVQNQLNKGLVEINVTQLTREDLIDLASRLKKGAPKIKALRLVCCPKNVSWVQYLYSHAQDPRSNVQHIFSTAQHKEGVQIASANVQYHKVRRDFYAAVCEVVRKAPIIELVLGMRFSETGYRMLAAALGACTTIKRLSFAGSHMGDERALWLKPGLCTNNSLEELDMTACDLSDHMAFSLAAVVKHHADRRMASVFDAQLREYPDASLPAHTAYAQYHARLREIARGVDESCGGLLHLELAENKLTDRAARALCEALSYDRRLIYLSLRANRLGAAAEREFVTLMKEHQALLRVDLRQNADPEMGILKLRHGSPPKLFNPALGFQPNPAAPAPPSPARTVHSMAFWQLRETADKSLPPSPMRSPAGSMAAPHSPGRMSTVSWGDANLLTRGSPRAAMAAAAAAARSGRAGSPRSRAARVLPFSRSTSWSGPQGAPAMGPGDGSDGANGHTAGMSRSGGSLGSSLQRPLGIPTPAMVQAQERGSQLRHAASMPLPPMPVEASLQFAAAPGRSLAAQHSAEWLHGPPGAANAGQQLPAQAGTATSQEGVRDSLREVPTLGRWPTFSVPEHNSIGGGDADTETASPSRPVDDVDHPDQSLEPLSAAAAATADAGPGSAVATGSGSDLQPAAGSAAGGAGLPEALRLLRLAPQLAGSSADTQPLPDTAPSVLMSDEQRQVAFFTMLQQHAPALADSAAQQFFLTRQQELLQQARMSGGRARSPGASGRRRKAGRSRRTTPGASPAKQHAGTSPGGAAHRLRDTSPTAKARSSQRRPGVLRGRRLQARRRSSKGGQQAPITGLDEEQLLVPETMAALEQWLADMAAEVARLEGETQPQTQRESRAEAKGAEKAAAKAARKEALQELLAAEAAEMQAAEEAKLDRERRAAAEAEEAQRRAAAEQQRQEEAEQAALAAQVARFAGAKPYGGAAAGAGVNVNAIVMQLDRWCSLCDDALLLPPR